MVCQGSLRVRCEPRHASLGVALGKRVLLGLGLADWPPRDRWFSPAVSRFSCLSGIASSSGDRAPSVAPWGLRDPSWRRPPLLLVDLVDGIIEGLHDMESIEHELGVGAMCLNGTHEGLAHVAVGVEDPGLHPDRASFFARP
jgi:hypothetical protein